jgi:tetratricopeptide (TPR) repeat protein
LPVPLGAEVSGPYLAARSADRATEFREAATYYTRALVEDPSNPALLEGLVRNQIMAGRVEAAQPVARRLQGLGVAVAPARMVLVAEQVRNGDFAALLDDLDTGEMVSLLVDGLTRGWAELGAGRMSEALGAFDAMVAQEGLSFFGHYHKALALALVGDLEAAEALLGNPELGLRVTRRAALAHLQVLARLDRHGEALAMLDTLFPDEEDSEIAILRRLLAAGAPVDFDILTSPGDGVAEVYLLLATALRGEGPEGQALLHARIAQYMRPDLHEAALLAASILEGINQNELAIEAYKTIPTDSAMGIAARKGIAQALYSDGHKQEAVDTLVALVEDRPDLGSVHLALADTLRQEERWLDAAAAYGAALDLIETPEPRHWAIFYSRGIAYERAKEWDRAEPDFRKALDLNPDQPQVLNYLGYSLLELNRNLEEALGMIERAVAQRPEDGYIIDSLAWGLFLLGRHDEALPHMERASLLMPVDPIVTDHLGDVYWAVGRHREARFQWRRALSFSPEEKDAERIRRKLEVGLDLVLAEEKARDGATSGN